MDGCLTGMPKRSLLLAGPRSNINHQINAIQGAIAYSYLKQLAEFIKSYSNIQQLMIEI